MSSAGIINDPDAMDFEWESSNEDISTKRIFFEALYDGNQNIVQDLLEDHRYLVNCAEEDSDEQWLPLVWASNFGDFESVELLLR
jgi:hypothetical protein